MQDNPVILVYLNDLLAGSMTFIKSHVDKLTRFRGYYVGSRRVRGIDVGVDKSVVVNRGGVTGFLEELMFRSAGFAPRMYSAVQSLDPVLVHAHFGTSGPSALYIAQKLNIPLVVTFHGKDATMSDQEARRSYRGRLLLRRKKVLIERTSMFIAVSEFIRRALIKRGYPEHKIIVHRNGIDTVFFQPDPSASKEPVVLFVGRFTEKKGVEYLIRATRRVQSRLPETELVLIGDGPLRAQLEAQAEDQLERYRFLGFQPLDVIRGWMNRAKVFAVPSVTAKNGDSEGLPTVLLEAQAMGMPVVATYHSGIPEGVIEGKTALLSKERDWEGLSEHLLYFLQNDSAVTEFGAAAREYICQEFDIRNQVSGLEALYSRILEEKCA